MLAKEIMSSKPDYLPPSATLKEAADKMRKHDHGFVLIGENDRLTGTVTDRDITIRAIAEGKDCNRTTLKDVMSKGVHFCFENDTIEKAAKIMKEHQIRRLPVLNADKRLTGILSLGDIARKCRNPSLCSELVEEVSTRH